MSTLKRSLIEKAIIQYGKITPCSGRSFRECFTRLEDSILFWFNDAGGNTHCIIEKEKVPA